MKHKLGNIQVEMFENNLGKFDVRLDNELDNQYINILTTNNKLEALVCYQALYDVLKNTLTVKGD